jgi:hypothetical protein
MKKIFVIVIMLLSSLSWGLTFKNGELVEDAIVAEEDIRGPDGEDILKDLEILIQ